MVVGENKRSNIMDGIENTGDVRLHDHRLRLKQRFDIVRKLGQGTYGKVQLGINKKTGQEVAIKTIKKCKIESEADLVRIRREVQIMSSVRHPNIVHIYEVFENSEKMILVMEYCSGGELYDYLSQKKVLQEDEARRLFRQIATAVYYCHIHKICHRDLKLENVLLDDTGSAKIADFGLSNVFKETSLLSTFCGSPLYASPEIVKGTPYIGPEVDCWSLGVLLYTLVYGAMPFDGSNFKRLVRQISNGDYYEPKNPSTASPLIRDMLTVDPLKRADIAYICDHSWVNTGCETSCLEMSEMLAAETPVRLDLLLSLAPAAPNNSVVVPNEGELGPEESGTDLTTSASMATVEPSNSAEKRILDLVAEGGEDAIKPSPTRTIVAAGDKRKLELAASASGMQRKKDRAASSAAVAAAAAAEEAPSAPESPPQPAGLPADPEGAVQPLLVSSATMTISPAPAPPPPAELAKDATREIVKETTPEEPKTPAKRVTVKKKSPPKADEKAEKAEDDKPSVAAAADKLTSLAITQPAAAPAPAPTPKPKKLSIPGGNVGSFKEQFERRASLTAAPEVKRNVSKPVVSKIAKPKAQSEDRELQSKSPDNGTVRLQQIGIEPSPAPVEELNRGGVKKTESEPSHSTPVDASVILQDARRSLQNSMAKLVEEKVGEENRRRAARDIISTAIRTGKPPVPYGRSSSAGVAALASPPGSPAAAAAAAASPRVFRTEAQHRVADHRPRGTSVERIIPISVTEEPPPAPPPQPRAAPPPLRRLTSTESNASAAESCSSAGEPIKKSAREFIIPIAVEGKGYVTPRQRSLEPEPQARRVRVPKPRRISSIVSGGESEEEDDNHMHRLRSSRAARAESVSSGEEDEEDEGFHLLTAENLFSTLLHRVRALTNRLNGEEGPGFPQHPHSLFNNLHQSPFFNSPHLPRRHLLWVARYTACSDQIFTPHRHRRRQTGHKRHTTIGNSKKSGKHQSESRTAEDRGGDEIDLSSIQLSEREARALSGLTPALARRLQRELLAQLPPAAARELRRTLSLHAPRGADPPDPPHAPHTAPSPHEPQPQDDKQKTENLVKEEDASGPPYSTLPRLARRSRDASPPRDEPSQPRPRATPERPLLSKYLTPERALSLDDSCSSDSGSLLAEPSYLAAYGSLAPRRHSMRAAAADQPKKRVSRFLRPDFFDAPPDETLFARQKREKELETQKILREIREKKNRSLDSSPRSPTEYGDVQHLFRDEPVLARKCVSPSILLSKERSRSNTPFFPMLDNIKETALDVAQKVKDSSVGTETDERWLKTNADDTNSLRDSKLTRPKSFPVKNLEQFDDRAPNGVSDNLNKEIENKDATLSRESKLIRPKSYPTSSPSPEKVYLNRSTKKDGSLRKPLKEETPPPPPLDTKNDVEVSFSISLPKKTKPAAPVKTESVNDANRDKEESVKDNQSANLVLKKYVIVNKDSVDKPEPKDQKMENGLSVGNGNLNSNALKDDTKEDTKDKIVTGASKKEMTQKSSELEGSEKKGTIKKKIIKKVSSKSKTDVGSQDADKKDGKPATEKKKVTKKVKEKEPENGAKPTVTKKKSVLQSIGHKLEKFASSKSNSPEKVCETKTSAVETKKESSKLNRTQREHSVPSSVEPPTESNLIKRAVTITDVATLENQATAPSKTTVSKVLGLFKKFEPKEKVIKPLEKAQSEIVESSTVDIKSEAAEETADDKPKRPTSLLLNGLGRKTKSVKTASDCVPTNSNEHNEQTVLKKDTETKNIRNSLKLDFSRLPRVKKIVPTDNVIEPQIMNVTSVDKESEKKEIEKNGTLENSADPIDTQSRSRSRSRSTVSNSEAKSDHSGETKLRETVPEENSVHSPRRNPEPTTPEREDIVDRIRRKSFYSRFNEKKQRRKSNLVGPGATEYDPLAVLHGPERSHEPSSPLSYDLSPGYSVASDLSPSTDRYRSLLTDLPVSTRNNVRYDTYGLNDKVDTYRSLDRNEFRKYPGSRSYLDYEQPPSYGTLSHRYSRTKSLLDNCDGTEEATLSSLRDPLKYNRTISMYSPGNYATYRPKKTRNSAIILKESEKEPSPENILERIRQRKNISISVTRKPDSEKETLPRSNISPKGEGDGPECSEKVN